MDWRKIKKIDAHVHLLPPKSLEEKKVCDPEVWGKASLDEYLKLMEKYNIQKAVLVPINEPYTYFNEPVDTNNWLESVKEKYKDKFFAFCDVVNKGYFNEFAPYWLDKAIKTNKLDGLKLHPANLGINFDSLDFVPVLRKAGDLKVPVMVHSYPYSKSGFETCLPQKIHTMAKIFPDVTFIISHLGGCRFMDAIEGSEYVDISTFLPELVSIYGIEQSNKILRAFGVDRLIFATDYPQVFLCKTEDIYETYFDILNKMDFTQEEAEQIAYKNIEKILNSNK